MIVAAGPVIPNFGSGSSCEVNNGWFCTEWVRQHWSDTLQPALFQHIELAGIAIAVGFVIAFALALAGFRYRLVDPPIGIVSDFLYTIPSLALFQILVPFTGITLLTVEIALVSYTLLILYRNMIEGLRAVPEEIVDAARGSGFTRAQTFTRVALPLALIVKEAPPGSVDATPRAQRPPVAPINEVLKRPAFYLLMIGSMCSIAAVGGANQHLKLSLSLDHGYAQEAAAQIASLTLAASLIGRLGMPDDIARGIVFLASDDAAFMTGAGLVIDGGLTAQ